MVLFGRFVPEWEPLTTRYNAFTLISASNGRRRRRRARLRTTFFGNWPYKFEILRRTSFFRQHRRLLLHHSCTVSRVTRAKAFYCWTITRVTCVLCEFFSKTRRAKWESSSSSSIIAQTRFIVIAFLTLYKII